MIQNKWMRATYHQVEILPLFIDDWLVGCFSVPKLCPEGSDLRMNNIYIYISIYIYEKHFSYQSK